MMTLIFLIIIFKNVILYLLRAFYFHHSNNKNFFNTIPPLCISGDLWMDTYLLKLLLTEVEGEQE